ncbi:hypothetical protein AtNW77_Chr1g0040471 [Arabidopsis thaliana]
MRHLKVAPVSHTVYADSILGIRLAVFVILVLIHLFYLCRQSYDFKANHVCVFGSEYELSFLYEIATRFFSTKFESLRFFIGVAFKFVTNLFWLLMYFRFLLCTCICETWWVQEAPKDISINKGGS